MILKHKHLYKTLLNKDIKPPTPIVTQRVNISFDKVPEPPSPVEVCASILDQIRYTDGVGESLQIGDRLYLDFQGLLPATNIDTGRPFRTQLQGESPNSTAVAFDNQGYVISIEYTC